VSTISKKVKRVVGRAAAALSQRQCDTVGRNKTHNGIKLDRMFTCKVVSHKLAIKVDMSASNT
jgi:hypothetical protein